MGPRKRPHRRSPAQARRRERRNNGGPRRRKRVYRMRQLPRVLKTRKGAVSVAAVAVALLVEASVVLAGPSSMSRHAQPPAALGGEGSVVRAGPPSRSRHAQRAPVTSAAPSSKVIVGHSVRNDVSPALRTIPAVPFRSRPEREGNRNPLLPSRHRDAQDTVVQRTLARPNMPAPTLNFDGIVFPGVACN